MEAANRANRLVRFKSFEFDLDTREVFRHGVKVKLQGHPADVLKILVEHAGELVTREKLRKALWPEDTFVDFEHSLNSAINKLREALGDNAASPRIVETLPRMGYRLIARIEMNPAETLHALPALPRNHGNASADGRAVESNPASNGPSVIPVSAVLEFPDTVQEPASGAEPAFWKIPRLRRWALAGCAVLVVVFSAAYGLLHWPLPAPQVIAQSQVTYGGLQKELVGISEGKVYLNLWDLRTIARTPISGGPIEQIPIDLPGFGDLIKQPPAHAPRLLDVSPDGSRLLVLDYGDSRISELWVVAASGTPAHYLVKARDATWSKDGRTVLFATYHGDVESISADGGTPRMLASTASSDNDPQLIADLRYSPDGRKIRFSQGRNIWEMSSDGSKLHRLLPDWKASSWKCCGRWTPNGEFFLFLSGDTALKGPLYLPGAQIWAMDERKGHMRQPRAQPVRLTSDSMLWGVPIPSVDGTKIYARGVTLRNELVRYEQQSHDFQQFLGGISAEFVDFSVDGKYVAYVSFPDGILWKANRDGSGREQLTKPPYYPKLIHWSPDGTQILFTDYSAAGLEAAYVVSSRGGTPIRVIPEDEGPEQDASWSPDGAKILFSSKSDLGAGQAYDQELRILDLGTHKITSIPDSVGMSSPRWSPDGRYIAGLSLDGADLRIFELQSQEWMIASEGSYPQSPVWARDSRSIYFVLYQNHGVYRLTIGKQPNEIVVDLKDFRHTGWNGLWLGLDPDDAPILLRDFGDDEIYQLTLK